MAYIEWSDEFSVNVKMIDAQHKKLCGMINKLHDAFVSRKGSDVHREIVDGMIDYAKTHFATEEKYMTKFDFVGLELHKIEHERFLEKALEFQSSLAATGFVPSINVLSFLKEWLQSHIQGTDKRYSHCFNEHGLQ